MRLLIVIAVLEIVALVFVVALCVAARRGDARTERMLSRAEIEARRCIASAPRRQPAGAARLAARRWWGRWFGGGSG
ncbi:hypothetical protein GIY62_23110 [Burkholderia plantarii]|nr:hypothetical protein GIY62_23110 [Burkholderia plantarii]